MFVDKANVIIKAGDGGDGAVSFRHEKFIDRGGPDGGDGGDGGDVILLASHSQDTLVNFRYQKRLEAENGKPGFKRRRHGRSGEDLVVRVPVGTSVISKEGELLADLVHDGQEAIIARGGKGGYGNAHFVSSTRQAPRVAEKGEQGDQLEVTFELKTIAEVGLVGLPNAGKSTLLASVSNARPEIANYPFTTLTPNLGVVDIDKSSSLLIADIPGLIEGASEGKGLGDEFLRHIERTLVLVHLIDIYDDDVTKAYQTIQDELKAYKINLSTRPQIVVLNKIEGLDDDIVLDKLDELKKIVPKGVKVMAISAAAKTNVPTMLYELKAMVAAERKKQERKTARQNKGLPVLTLKSDEAAWTVTKNGEGFVVKGRKIEKFAERTDFANHHAVQRLRDIMRRMGITRELNRLGIQPDDRITIGDNTFTY
jgi:GTPase